MKSTTSMVAVAIAALLVNSSVNAAGLPADKPQTMEEMWKIIQAQQQQIDSMTKKLESVAQKAPVNNDVSSLESKTNVLTEEVEKLRTELVVPEKVEYKSAYG